MKPLSVGNVVSAGLRIYRDNFKNYYRLALIGSLWFWIPVYGWAKYYSMQGTISRLAYGELIEKPETNQDAQHFIQRRFWGFLVAALLVFLRFVSAYIIGGIAISLGAGIIITALSAGLGAIFGDAGSFLGGIISIIIILAASVLFLSYLIRLIASFFVSELPLSLEDNVNASISLKKSQELTKGYLVNLVIIFIISSAISIPFWGLIFMLQGLLEFIQNSNNFAVNSTIFTIFSFIFNSITSALIIPFWQAIKAVVYYDLRVRREGMGINLRK